MLKRNTLSIITKLLIKKNVVNAVEKDIGVLQWIVLQANINVAKVLFVRKKNKDIMSKNYCLCP
jgi:hypothetical protein